MKEATNKAIKVVGSILITGVIIMGVLYLIRSSDIARYINPELLFGQMIGGFHELLTGIQKSISGMFSNFTK